ncbi:O-succinylhomoserine sulfhydrylase [Bradyrhizobium sp. U87765 SZCCT0131]|uniref:O-succinylhomoserine sulfhydrylase n=1 Tax=unclassified Bradyrhizobium TaxID=2631580 RepID=UPI001BAA936D|nr:MULTISPECIES: O-succinylhomoserine sulfhydrylase [unclassified Bradyrhizobium]MBR1221071.1 O-succinylhomoserine sulfhydrylase [Bradyrhizobium sp. U87765 SZCCT0131]MBR1260109.1 O-succinylhomoserine sulfhydrylase [Bradyrhizobium sp. U87765 SZCCT0134]MBR1307642.1 O-succinylhomoserine sulfhydrylase [Bradyrhizobium sp. U87765 SZCCT0110]MBR1321596.1 O-succinylhomoserine sulfhydrylase [Bradyrhizobium sp. U87765 SZCCT0109]MBR1349909.1 O-succinylhomoserine sulfhydrylase [Bradyrhizobium sp. U87765 SZ
MSDAPNDLGKGPSKTAPKPPSATARYRPETRLVHGGSLRSQYGETSEALFLTQGFIYDTAEQCEARFTGEDPGFLYSRFSNPTVAMFEQRMIELEGAEAARSTATGMAAVTTAILAPLRAGDHVVAAKALFGSCRYVVEDLLPRYGIESTLVDGMDLDQWQKAMRPNTRTCFLESPTNPTLDVVDIAAVAEIAHKGGARLVVDNVFATPIWQSPLQLGADVVVYSATKHIDGQGRCLGGVILSSEQFIQEHIHTFLRQTGPSMSPFNAWVLLKGLETLAIRVRQQTDSAAAIADALAKHPKISRLIYPGRDDHPQAAVVKKQMRGGSTLVGFEIKGGKAAAFRTLNALKLARISNNLGDSKSIVTHPATTTHQRLTPEARAELGISEGFIRFSAGLEHRDDLIEDLFAALEQA